MTLTGVDEDDFEEWYERAWPAVLRGLRAAGVGTAEAEDAAAEAFSRAWARWRRLAATPNPTGWTYRVAVNVARRAHRRRMLDARLHLRQGAALVPPPGVPSGVWSTVATLPARQREALALRYIVGLPQHEVAAWMGVRPGTVAATLAAARARLRSVIDFQEISE